MMNGRYSAIRVCSTTDSACVGPYSAAKGSRNASAQAADTLPKWWCQKPGVSSGHSAMASRIAANGSAQTRPSAVASNPAASTSPLARPADAASAD